VPILVSDLDGTLLDVRDRFAHSQVNALAALGYPVKISQVYPLIHYTMDANKFLGALGISLSNNELAQYYTCIEQEFYKGWQYSQVFPGAIEVLQSVRPRFTALRLITSRAWVKETRREVKEFGLDHLFDHPVVTRGDLARAEGVDEVPLYPYLEHRQRLIQLSIADVEPQNTVWVLGDSPSEMQAAKGLNYITIGVLTGFATKAHLEPICDYVINSVADITTLLDSDI
jgi:phosphoglycolate phosphatase-like HAD superfamily hydrolase